MGQLPYVGFLFTDLTWFSSTNALKKTCFRLFSVGQARRFLYKKTTFEITSRSRLNLQNARPENAPSVLESIRKKMDYMLNCQTVRKTYLLHSNMTIFTDDQPLSNTLHYNLAQY